MLGLYTMARFAECLKIFYIQSLATFAHWFDVVSGVIVDFTFFILVESPATAHTLGILLNMHLCEL